MSVGTTSLATWHAVPPSDKSNGCQIFNHQHGVVRESHFILFEKWGKQISTQCKGECTMDPSRLKNSSLKKTKRKKGNERGKF
jgi:hypothetical protein